MARKQRTDQELEAAALHVGYELTTMVKWLWHQYCDDRAIPVVFLEAGLTHARNVIEFLDRNVDAQRISPIDYVPGWNGPYLYKDDYNEVCAWLSHLGWQRVDEPAPEAGDEWDPRDLVRRLVGSFEDFVSQIPANRQAWFAGSVQHAKLRLAEVP